MIKEVKEFMCDFDYTPTDEDIQKCLEIAKRDNCVVKLCWNKKWSGHYSRCIRPEHTFEEIKESLPKIYGM